MKIVSVVWCCQIIVSSVEAIREHQQLLSSLSTMLLLCCSWSCECSHEVAQVVVLMKGEHVLLL
jgi:hypothetical protein